MLDQQQNLLTVDDLARLTREAKSTIYKLNSSGRGPRRMRIGRHVRYRPADVQEWLSSRYVKVDGDAA